MDVKSPSGVEIKDAWKHRSKGMKCSTCMWYANKDSETGDKMFGRCRRHAPTMTGYPAVFGIDWCGDHKLDENKI
jgi:hypothetical protein